MDIWRLAMMFALRLALVCVILGAVYKYLGLIPFILGTPVAGVLLAKPILEAGGSWINWASKQPLVEWQGRYYEFANTQIRIFEVDKELWIVDADLLQVIGEKPTLMLESLYNSNEYELIPDTKFRGFSPEGAEKVLSKSTHFESKRMLIWLQREVYKQHRRKLELDEDAQAKAKQAS